MLKGVIPLSSLNHYYGTYCFTNYKAYEDGIS